MSYPAFDYSGVMSGIYGQLLVIAWEIVKRSVFAIGPALLILGLETIIAVGLPLFERFLDDREERHLDDVLAADTLDTVYGHMMDYYDLKEDGFRMTAGEIQNDGFFIHLDDDDFWDDDEDI